MRRTIPSRISIVSPGPTSRAGLTRSPPTFTWPARTSSVAALLVFAKRAAHSHLSMRTRSTDSLALESAVDRDQAVPLEDVGPGEAGVGDQPELVWQRDIEVLLRPLAKVYCRLRRGDPVSRHVGKEI